MKTRREFALYDVKSIDSDLISAILYVNNRTLK